MNIVADLRALIGENAVLPPEVINERACGVWNPDPLQGAALARPASTKEVSQVVKYCHDNDLTMVTHGGLTGLVHGADAVSTDVIISLERMTAIESIDPQQRCAIAQAGVKLQAFQEALEPYDLMFPLDLGARGTASLGGNAATNAGGNRVIRYGMMRDMVLGLEAVLADGTIVTSLNTLIKNNTGYDLKQLFIGSEGTLGIITRLSLRLREAPLTRNMALVGLDDFDNVIALLKHMDKALGGTLSAFETLWQPFYRLVTTPPAHGRPPISQDYPYYVLLESQGADPDGDTNRFNASLEQAFEDGLIVDAAISQSESDCEAFWALRDDVEQIFNNGMVPFIHDVSVPVNKMAQYAADVQRELDENVGECELFLFGHLGDGNLHPTIRMAADKAAEPGMKKRVSAAVYEPMRPFNGSVSAEHGIGLEKKPYLDVSRSAEEIGLMRLLKGALDPKGLLNPGKIF